KLSAQAGANTALGTGAPVGGTVRKSFDASEPVSDLQPGAATHVSTGNLGIGGGSGGAAVGWTTGAFSGVGFFAAGAFVHGASLGPGVGGELLFPGTRLSLAGRSGGRWVVFCCDCAAHLVQAGGGLAALAAGRRTAVERSLPLAEVPDQLEDSRLSAMLRHTL
ncbi:hypothetical protein Vretifemale_1548, partial [Volvox reticuliferus]